MNGLNYDSLRKKTFVVLLIMLFVVLGSATVIASIPVESFPLNGTFKYSISVDPDFGNNGFANWVSFWYGSNYGIVEPQFQQLAQNRLRVLARGNEGIESVPPLEGNFGVEVRYYWNNISNNAQFNSSLYGNYVWMGVPMELLLLIKSEATVLSI